MTFRFEISRELWVVEWIREPRWINSSTTATSSPRTVIVDSSSSLLAKAWTFVFYQFSWSLRHAASDAIVSSAGTRSSSSLARRVTSVRQNPYVKMSAEECLWMVTWPMSAEDLHSIHVCANSSLQQPVYARGERVWCQHTLLANAWHLKFFQHGGGRHLGFVRTVNSAVRNAVPENPTLEPNVGGQRWHH